MFFRSLSLSIFFALVIVACKTTKKTQLVKDDVSIMLDTISVMASDPVKREIYRASVTKDNDLIDTKLEVNFDWKLCRMNGKATIRLKPHFYPTNILYLNARGMDIKKVEVMDAAKTRIATNVTTEANKPDAMLEPSYVYKNDSLRINLGRVFTSKENYFVIIDYVAKPNELTNPGGSAAISDDKGLYFVNTTGENPYKMPQIWTQGETQASSAWFPTIDNPGQKTTMEILMTVEDKYLTLSNGTLIHSDKKPNGMRTDHWKLDQPHAPYLAMMAVGEFKKVTDEPWNGKEISYYVEPMYEEHAKTIFGDTKEMIDFYSSVLGVPYEWPKYAQIVARDYVSGAMENTSATLHGDFMVYQTTREMLDGKKGNSVIAHELFHQWFGDLVTCESWSNLSLNESFATYGEYLWEEHKFGRDAADYHLLQSRQGYLGSSKEVNIIRFNYNDKEDMFDAFSYNKGGQIIHMLRKAVGDDAFFASLKKYLETNKFKTAEIHNLRLAFEEVTGRDMNWFFNQWYLSSGRPSLKIKTQSNTAGDSLKITIEQVQDLKKCPLYTLPLEVDFYINNVATRKHIELTEQKQTFAFAVSGRLQLVNVDAERQLLADIEYPKTTDEYLFQARNTPLYQDRLEALKALEPKIKEDAVFGAFKEVAEKDKSQALRRYAISQLEKAEGAQQAEVKTLFLHMYIAEKNTVVKAKLLEALNKVGPATEIAGMNIAALNDQSYAVIVEGLNGIAKNDPKLALEKAGPLEREGGKDIIFAIANIYANNGGDGQIHFFHDALKYINGFDLMSFSAFYTKTSRKCLIPQNAITSALDLEMIGKGAHKYIKYTALNGLKELVSTWDSKQNSASVKLENAKKANLNTADPEKEYQLAKQTYDKLLEIYNRAKK
ncbi:hypothetical protein CNR22_08340 [Sphingobacteriaceae bacterium]|nr:hypothetical protein CNR22_08340 [Sphingobacteriaceae bacterium]